MIFERKWDREYRTWFAWRPVFLRGPDEWDRMRRRGARARFVWLRFIWRARMQGGTYYALPSPNSTNAMLLDAVDKADT